MVDIREPSPADAEALGSIHVRAWQAAYSGGLLPDEYLDGLVEADRADLWREWLSSPPPDRSARLVAVDSTIGVVGFILVGPFETNTDVTDADPADTNEGQVHAINVDPDHWGIGVGSILIDAGLQRLSHFGFTRAVLWVHAGNVRARSFYLASGWVDDGIERTETVLEAEAVEARYSIELRQPDKGKR